MSPSHHLQVGVNERAKSTNASVDTRLAGSGAALTPGNKTNELLGAADNGASTVTLAGVLATSGETGAEHVVGDLGDAVVVAAGSAGDDGHIDLEQVGGEGGATGGGGSPASNGEGAGGVVARGSKGGVADGRAGGDGGGELPDGNVVVEGSAVEAGVNLDRGDADESSAGAAALQFILEGATVMGT